MQCGFSSAKGGHLKSVMPGSMISFFKMPALLYKFSFPVVPNGFPLGIIGERIWSKTFLLSKALSLPDSGLHIGPNLLPRALTNNKNK
jgi:hypothetical protein